MPRFINSVDNGDSSSKKKNHLTLIWFFVKQRIKKDR